MSTTTEPEAGYAKSPIQRTALIVGIVFLLVGIAGFIPGVTHSAEHLHGVGADSEAQLLGVFQVSVLHNLVHLVFGVAGLAAAARVRSSRLYLIVGGLVYLIVWIYGLIAVTNAEINFLPVNDADNWLHLALAAGMILLGLFVARPARNAQTAAGTPRA
ncbi:DUF4383 domain-containing protein [Microbacterium sp. W4I20]|uniref:DUF4383 domain-containing protein n=1 Tax=Microbacterium sp. W4I20 TaxID=3042262 RepID=UPI0027874608|nr:DUF4383 domain-containing protein [Microbacterium sp. W4I20]MDQ0729145.1 putative integral membrane protein [Microbacterium sp. W4I20]